MSSHTTCCLILFLLPFLLFLFIGWSLFCVFFSLSLSISFFLYLFLLSPSSFVSLYFLLTRYYSSPFFSLCSLLFVFLFFISSSCVYVLCTCRIFYSAQVVCHFVSLFLSALIMCLFLFHFRFLIPISIYRCI